MSCPDSFYVLPGQADLCIFTDDIFRWEVYVGGKYYDAFVFEGDARGCANCLNMGIPVRDRSRRAVVRRRQDCIDFILVPRRTTMDRRDAISEVYNLTQAMENEWGSM